jgi:flagellar hook-basal body complex protein FliE
MSSSSSTAPPRGQQAQQGTQAAQATQNPPQAQADQTEEDILAEKIGDAINHALDRLKPLLKLITETVDKANKTPKEDLDEDALVDKLKPVIEEAQGVLNETLGLVKGLDPTGAIAKNAQKNTSNHQATAAEQKLAVALTQLTGDVTKTIENAKEKIKDMPKAGPKLGALLGLLQDPLFQILSAVGLLLNGVLTLVGNLLNGLGLGGIVRNLLSGLGLDKILKGLGLGKILG